MKCDLEKHYKSSHCFYLKETGPSLADAYESLRLSTLAEYGPAAGMVATGRLRMFCTHPSLVSKALGERSP